MSSQRPGLGDAVQLLQHRSFRHLWFAQGISEIGDWVTNVALMLLVFQLLGHPAAAALVLLAKLVPRVVVYPFGGVLADKFNRHFLLIATCLLRAGLAFSLLLVQSPAHLWWAFLATSLSQVLASLFNPTAMAVVPTIVPKEQLSSANALINAIKESAFFIGPLVGAVAIAVGGVPLAFIVDAGTFLTATALLTMMGVVAQPTTPRKPLRIREDLHLGWVTVRGHSTLGVLFTAQMLVGLMIAALNALLVPLLILHWHAPEGLLGTLYAGVGAGSLLGSFVAMRLPAARYINAALITLGLIGCSALSLGFIPWFWPSLGVLILVGMATMIGDVAAGSYIQTHVANDRLGRIFGLLFWVVALGQAIGACMGLAASTFSPALLLIALGMIVLLAALWLIYRQHRVSQPAAHLVVAPPSS